MIDDFGRFAFFPLNDGKTPLQFWLMIPGQLLPLDQLLTARATIALIGLIQVAVMGWLAKIMGGRTKAILLSMLLTTVLPYWYMHHRLAVLDGLLALMLSLVIGFSWLANKQLGLSLKNIPSKDINKKLFSLLRSSLPATLMAGLFFGLALVTKLPAVLILPSLYLLTLYRSPNIKVFTVKVGLTTLIVALGLAIFFSLKLHPAFGQLFSRGGDFLFPFREVIFDGYWRDTLINTPTFIWYFGSYLTWSVLILNVSSLFIAKKRARSHLLFWSGVLFLAPMILLGRVVYPRYLFPAAIFFTLNAGLILAQLISWVQTNRLGFKATLVGVTLVILLANTLTQSANFIYYSLTDTNQLPLVSADKKQFIYEWSSGHGIKETAELIQDLSREQTVAVATEGYFGTLPDGLTMYFHRRSVDNIFIDGVGQPLREIPEKFMKDNSDFDQVLLVINSHRRLFELPRELLLLEVCRPDDAPCLEVWDLTTLRNQP